VSSYAVNATARDANGQIRSFAFSATLQVSVPNVFSFDQASALASLSNYGLSAKKANKSDCWSPGDVENEVPAGGTVVPLGSTVNLTISTCPPPPPGNDGGTPRKPA
jgi:beta-lactam-binding protein with PASTA domain